MSALGYPRISRGFVWLGDVPPSTITYGGIITNATYTDASNVVTITLTHSTIPYSNYIIVTNTYSNRSDTFDNDWAVNNVLKFWVRPVSTTSTYLQNEYTSGGDFSRT